MTEVLGRIGVYRLAWAQTGDFYIGASKDLPRRRREHFRHMRNGIHANKNIQRLFELHGFPEFEVIEYCTIGELSNKEQFHLAPVYSTANCLNVFEPTPPQVRDLLKKSGRKQYKLAQNCLPKYREKRNAARRRMTVIKRDASKTEVAS